MESTARWRILVLVGLALGALVSSSWALWRTCDLEGLALNLGTELIGALATYGLLELFIGGRERREAKKADLIAQMGSRVHDVAIAATEELRRHGWLHDGSLRGADLHGANLEGAHLNEADLEGVRLEFASLQRAYLYKANLKRVNFGWAKLRGANLQEANLEGAFMVNANLEGASLNGANLREVYMSGAKVQRAGFSSSVYHSLDGTRTVYTILPDGTKYTQDTDITRFTDYNHPDWWRPDKYK